MPIRPRFRAHFAPLAKTAPRTRKRSCVCFHTDQRFRQSVPARAWIYNVSEATISTVAELGEPTV